MPFCPKCKAEYEAGITQCSDCQIPLVNQLLQCGKDELRETGMVQLLTVPNDIEAVMICELLKQARIEATIRSGTMSGLVKVSSDQTAASYWWSEILVLDIDYQTAKGIVDEYLRSINNQHKE
ncbi:MAG: putative signal transducing protein [bacterium]